MSELKVITLSNGQTLIGKISKLESGLIKIDDPKVLGIEPSQNGGYQVVFSQFLVFTKDKHITIKESGILFDPQDPTEELRAAYTKADTGLITGPSLLT